MCRTLPGPTNNQKGGTEGESRKTAATLRSVLSSLTGGKEGRIRGGGGWSNATQKGLMKLRGGVS